MSVLIVDDNREAAAETVSGLQDLGLACRTASTGSSALVGYEEVDAVLLEVRLPDIDGFEVCRRIRATSDVPILMVSGRADETDRVLGLKLGADDYVVKPYGLRELAARVEAVVRRCGRPSATTPECGLRSAGPFCIDLRRRRAFVEGQEVRLTGKEFNLLALLMSEPGVVFTRSSIMSAVWGYVGRSADTRTLSVHMAALRRKLGRPECIETVRGFGFRLVT